MISFIRGLVADTTENAVILENNGIGYEIFMTCLLYTSPSPRD